MSAPDMLAAVYYGPEDLRIERRPVPAVEAGGALLKIVSAGVCGTDLRIFHGAHRKYPPGTVRVPGHECRHGYLTHFFSDRVMLRGFEDTGDVIHALQDLHGLQVQHPRARHIDPVPLGLE